MISNRMQSAINDQINAELWSAYLYLAMSMDAEAKAMKGIANWFFIQWLEEQDHARIFQNFLNDRGGRVHLKPIAGVQTEWHTALEMFEDTLRHEREVTEMIEKLVKMAIDESDFATLSRLQWFIDEQVEEEKSASDQIADFKKAEGDFAAQKELDDQLSERRYRKAGPLGE